MDLEGGSSSLYGVSSTFETLISISLPKASPFEWALQVLLVRSAV